MYIVYLHTMYVVYSLICIFNIKYVNFQTFLLIIIYLCTHIHIPISVSRATLSILLALLMPKQVAEFVYLVLHVVNTFYFKGHWLNGHTVHAHTNVRE